MNDDIDTLLGRLDAHPGSLVFARLASAYLKADKVNQAIEVCEQGLSHHSDYVSGHMVMASCYFKVGLLEQAEKEYHRVLELDSEHEAAYYHLGEIYIEQKRIDLALDSYQHILRLDPLNETARKRINQLKGLKTDMIPTTNLHDIDTESDIQEDSILTPTLAEVYASQGLTDRAISVLRRLLEQDHHKEFARKRLRELEKQLQLAQAGGDHGHNG